MSQTPEDRMYRYFKSLRNNREYRRGYNKGWNPSPLMATAQRFGVPVRTVKEVVDSRKTL